VVRKYVIPPLALVSVAVAVLVALTENRPTVVVPAAAQVARSPYEQTVVGAGIVEASTRNIAVGTPVAGIVTRVMVKPGDEVNAGDPLFALDERVARAELETRHAELLVAERTLSRLKNLPRAEELAPAEAKVTEAEALLLNAQSRLAVAEAAGAEAQVEIASRRYAADAARARLAQARGQLDLLKAGAWKEDLDVALAQVELGAARVKAAQTDLDRLTVRAPIDGEVLQVNVLAGEFAPAAAMAAPLVLLGDTRTLHVRVDVDEYDAWRVRPEAPAQAALRGNSNLKTDLTFVRFEPYVVPKKSLTGAPMERTDTRVLQVLYSFPQGRIPVFVGQQLDVFIDAAASVEAPAGP